MSILEGGKGERAVGAAAAAAPRPSEQATTTWQATASRQATATWHDPPIEARNKNKKAKKTHPSKPYWLVKARALAMNAALLAGLATMSPKMAWVGPGSLRRGWGGGGGGGTQEVHG